jgi:hypothetical protein
MPEGFARQFHCKGPRPPPRVVAVARDYLPQLFQSIFHDIGIRLGSHAGMNLQPAATAPNAKLLIRLACSRVWSAGFSIGVRRLMFPRRAESPGACRFPLLQ